MFNPSQARTLAISGDALPTWSGASALLPLRLSGTEELGKLYTYTLDLASTEGLTAREAHERIVPTKLIGSVVHIAIEFEGHGTFVQSSSGDRGASNVGAGKRVISGLVTDVQMTGSDHRHAYYRFVVRPWLWLATKNRESRVFQNVSVTDLTDAILKRDEYLFPVDMQLGFPGLRGSYPKRDFVRQMWESDFAFLTRIWREWGIYYRFDGLTLILYDSPGGHRPHDNAYDTIRYHAPDAARIDEEHIHKLTISRKLTGGKTTLTDYDYTRPLADFKSDYDNYSDAALDHAEHYRWGDYSQPRAGAMGLSGQPNDHRDEARHLASVRVDAMRCRSLRLKGRGNLRGLTTGKTFRLEEHPQTKVNAEYLVVSTAIDIQNVSETSLQGERATEEGQYRCVTDFVLQPANAFFKNRPKKKPRCSAETALVVGPKDQPMWVDGLARVKVQFVWDRLGTKDEDSSCWVRVSSPWQGNGFGTTYLPRIGQEVTISYHEGDPDKPYVSDRMVNGMNEPPWKLPDNQALSGTLTRDLKGRQSNQFVADDTPGKLQVQVGSDHEQSRLVLGYNTRIISTEGRKEARGEGYELATDSWGVMRAIKGMLISTDGASGASAPAKEADAALARLTRARDTHETLVEAAQKNEAQETAGANQSEVTKAIKAQNDAIRGDARASETDFPEFNERHIAIASGAGIGLTAAKGVHVASNEDFAVTTGRHIGIAAGRSVFASVRDAFSLFTAYGGMKLVAALGKISIVARDNLVEIISKHLIQLLSQDQIKIHAANRITLNAGGSQIVLSKDGFFVYTNGQSVLHSGAHALDGPLSVPTGMAPLAAHPMALNCSALAAVELTDPAMGGTGSAVSPSALAEGSPTPAPAPELMQILIGPGKSQQADANEGSGEAKPVGAAATGHTCIYKIAAKTPHTVTVKMECTDYWAINGDGTPMIDRTTGKEIFSRFSGASGTYDIGYDAQTSTITATVRVLLIPKRVRLRSATTKELLNNPDGTPLWVPYDNDLDTKDPEKTNRIIEDRPIAEVENMDLMKGNIEKVLNQNAYKLTIGNCPQGDACSCQIPVFFRVEFVTDANKPHHAKVNLFVQAERADSGNWGEENVFSYHDEYVLLENEHVQAHETGHLFSFPDEYYAGGGAIHADYIKDQHVDIKLANASRDKDKWQGVTASNLMGIGVYSATSETPSYYLYRVRNWFNAVTGREWKIIPLNKAK